MLGLNPWVVNEGQMDSSERLSFTLAQAQALGLLAQGPSIGEGDGGL
jgi:hypothetical protein